MSFWYNARAALWHAAHALGLRPGDRVLVPAYSCGSEVDALLKAGLTIDYYPLASGLHPDLSRLEDKARAGARALLVTHYFGFAQPMGELCALAARHGLAVIEDNAHGLYSEDDGGRPLGTFGHVGVFSLAKTLPLPDGGVLLSSRAASGAAAPKPPAARAVAGKLRHLLEEGSARRFPRGTALVKERLVDPMVAWLKSGPRAGSHAGDATATESMDILELKSERAGWGMSRVAGHLLRRCPHDAIRDRRRQNYRRFLDTWRPHPIVAPLIPELPRGTCPLFFPVHTDNPARLQRQLLESGVQTVYFWSFFHPTLPPSEFPAESALKRSVLALPVHQDLGPDDVDRMAARLAAFTP